MTQNGEIKMTKTLTEQWRDGTLRGCFYWKLPNGNICTAYTDTMRDIKKVRDSDEVEVLQETPSYVEYNELVQKTNILEKKLAIATKALKEYADRENYHDFDDDYDEPIWNIGSPIMHAELALKQIKELDK